MAVEDHHPISTHICPRVSRATCSSQLRICSLKVSQEVTYSLLAKAQNNKRISIVTNSKFTGHLIRTIVMLLFHQVSGGK